MRTIMPFMTAALLVAALVQAQQQGSEKDMSTGKAGIRNRTERSETLGITGAKSCMTKIYTRTKFVRDAGGWEAIDLAAAPEERHGFSHVVHAGSYISRFDPSQPEHGLRFERDEIYVTYSPAGKWTGRTVKIEHTAEGVKETIILSRDSDVTVC